MERQNLIAAALLATALFTQPDARGTHGGCYACSHRRSSIRHDFMSQSGYPHGRPIDHVVPLKRGADASINMQWQTKDEQTTKAVRERREK